MTYEDIARAAGVSTATVSRVLTGSGAVSAARAKRVMDAVEQLSYRSSRPARTLRRQRADTIGLIVSDVEYPFVASMARAVEQAAAERGFALTVCNTDEDLERERTYVDLMLEEKVAGVIAAPATEDSPNLTPLLEAGTPVVTVDRLIADRRADAVLLDNAIATRLLVDDLLAHGHRSFVAVLGTTTATPSRERLAAMRAALASTSGTTLTVAASGLRETVGVQHTLETIGASVLRLTASMRERPTAFVCANAIMLTSLMETFQRAGIRVPDDAAVVGFDDMPGFSLFAAPVTVVAQPVRLIGRSAVDLLFDHMHNPTRERRVVRVAPELILRRSCGHGG